MNEGWATFWHYTLLNRLHQKGRVTDGFMIEVLQSHTNVVSQRGFDERGYGGVNPYALGFSMMQDIRRICERPDEEDRRWFPDIAGSDWLTTLDFAMRNFKDESFISQYLSPRLIREFRFFAIADHQANPKLEVAAIHDDEGYGRSASCWLPSTIATTRCPISRWCAISASPTARWCCATSKAAAARWRARTPTRS
ncbi:SpoVR family protein [Bordetella pertussis]|nr:SpoVR family protein [Bordetella pertussis]